MEQQEIITKLKGKQLSFALRLKKEIVDRKLDLNKLILLRQSISTIEEYDEHAIEISMRSRRLLSQNKGKTLVQLFDIYKNTYDKVFNLQ